MKKILAVLGMLLVTGVCSASEPYVSATPPSGLANGFSNLSLDPNGNLRVATPASGTPAAIDPCFTSSTVKSSVAINVSTATTTSLVSISGTTSVYVCGFTVIVSGTTLPTVQFEYGTGAACSTPTVLTGSMGAASGGFTTIASSNDGTDFKAPSATGLCIVTGGTGPSAQGFVTYVQQ